jgi:predicted nucleotidyltransferase
MKGARHKLTDQKKKELIQRIVSYLQLETPGLLSAYVFGSFITGQDFADIDLALLLDSPVSDTLKFEFSAENGIERLLRMPADVRVLNGAPLSFRYQVVRDGRLIFDGAPNRRADFEGQVLKQYFDFSGFRRRYLKEVAHAPL